MRQIKFSLSDLFFIIVAILMFAHVENSYGINDGNRYVSQSILNTSTGKWIKLKVEKNAIYKLTYNDIVNMGIEDPSKAKIYGYGGWILDEDFRIPFIDDLPEVACWISGNDEILDNDEYLLFYGRGSVKWSYVGGEYIHENNPYSTYGTYFLTDATSGNPKRMGINENIEIPAKDLSIFEDYMLHEKDEFSLLKSGRELYGENFIGNNSQSFPFTIDGIVEGSGSISFSFISTIKENTPLNMSVNNATGQFTNCLATMVYPSINTSIMAALVERKIDWETTKNPNTIIQIDHSCGSYPAYLNYIRLNMNRSLKYYDTTYTFFRHSENLKRDVKYNIQNANKDLLVFDITGNYDVKLVDTDFDPISNILSFYSPVGAIREFVLVDPLETFDTPQKLSDVEPQNLHGMEQIEMAIISPTVFVSEAERLAQKHREHSGLIVKVVTAEQIYNEFSSGTPDASAYRRFMKMFYDRAVTNNGLKPKYLLLFGDSMYDNRFLTSGCKGFDKDNFLLSYQTVESIKIDESYLCDDYFGFLDEADEKSRYMSRKLMLGVGRFPIQDLTSAKNVVNKTIAYMENKNPGIWKNSVVAVADDSDITQYDPNLFTLHLNQADNVAFNVMQKEYPQFMLTKIYYDAFKPEKLNGRKTFANSAKKIFEKALADGCLVFNYTGHANTVGIADGMSNITDIRKMSFRNLPLWVMAACDFGWFDGEATSASEEVLLSESAGIALLTTTRVVYAEDNVKINLEFMKNLFKKTNDTWQTIGDAFRACKNTFTTNSSKMNYVLIGDPALTLNYPENRIEINKIEANGNELTDRPAVIKALDRITVSGYIKGDDNQINTDFNGPLTANVYDGLQTMQTITVGYDTDKKEYRSKFTDYPNRISSSYCDVVNGRFEFSFSVMADIANVNELGKINLYAYDTNSKAEVNGSFMNYKVLGVNEDIIFDTSSPEINKIYLNNESFMNGGVVNETPLFVAEVSDELGINMSGAGMGHNIEIIINKSPKMTYNLNSYYQPTTGIINYLIPALPEGEYELEFRVWNILNNLTTRTLNFVVEKEPVFRTNIYELTANPNLAKIGTGTSFEFTHNKPGMKVEISIAVFDMSGRLVWEHKNSGISELISAYQIPWDLKNSEGVNLQPGVYLYNVSVKSEEGVETTSTKRIIVTK